MHESPMPGDEPRRTRMRWNPRYSNPFFAGLVVIAGEFHPIPFRTRPLKPPAPMVLRVNTRESRSPPGLQRTDYQTIPPSHRNKKPRAYARGFLFDAGLTFHAVLTSEIAEQAHILPYGGARVGPAVGFWIEALLVEEHVLDEFEIGIEA